MTVPRLSSSDYLDPVVDAHCSERSDAGREVSQPHCHDFFELFLVTEGMIEHRVNGEAVRLPEGGLVLVRPDDVHCYHFHPGGCRFINLAFSRRVFNQLVDFLGYETVEASLLTPVLPPVALLGVTRKEQAQAKLEQICWSAGRSNPQAGAKLRLLLAEFLLHHFLQDNDEQPGKPQNWLEEVRLEMAEPENLRGGIKRMQQLCGRSPEHLARSCRQRWDCTPTELLNSMRLKAAAQMLYQTDRPVLEIAVEVGYHSLSYFYRRFKGEYHLSPEKYRRQFR